MKQALIGLWDLLKGLNYEEAKKAYAIITTNETRPFVLF